MKDKETLNNFFEQNFGMIVSFLGLVGLSRISLSATGRVGSLVPVIAAVVICAALWWRFPPAPHFRLVLFQSSFSLISGLLLYMWASN